MAEDFYKTLGVSRDASQADIQKAYRKLARQYHPDLHPDDKDAKKKFQEIQAAFDVLDNPSKREMYDRYGSSFESMGRGAEARGGAGQGGAAGFEDFDFSQFFGERYAGDPGGGFSEIFNQFRRAGGKQGRASTGSRRGADVAAELEIPFQTAVLGGQRQISLHRASGKIDTLLVKIPAGIEDGQKIRLRGQGEPAGRRGTPGDVLVAIRVAPHPSFERRGNNLSVKVPVTLAEAALGAKIDLPTPRGTIALHVPPATSSGAKLRVKGHGVVREGQPPGDLMAEIQIVLPKLLDAQSQSLVTQLADHLASQQPNPRGELRW